MPQFALYLVNMRTQSERHEFRSLSKFTPDRERGGECVGKQPRHTSSNDTGIDTETSTEQDLKFPRR